MVISTYTIRLNGFDPVPILVFAVWTIRPRLVITPLLWLSFHICGGRKGGNNPYLWTFKDNVVEETLLNIFSLPFALLFIKLRDDTDEYGCASQPAYQHFWNSFYLMAAVGAISLIILFFMVIHGCCGRNKDEESLSLFWKLTLFFAGLNMFAGFAGQWLLWGSKYFPFSFLGAHPSLAQLSASPFLYNLDRSTNHMTIAFISNAGTDFCPGSLVGEIASWAIGLAAIALGRAFLGGPSSN